MRHIDHNATVPITAVMSSTAPKAMLSWAPTDKRFSALRTPERG
jgi:hypothetical protein